MDQDQLNPYVAYEGYVVRVPHNQPKCVKGCSSPKFLGTLPSDYLSVTPSESEGNIELVNEWPEYFLSHAGSLPIN